MENARSNVSDTVVVSSEMRGHLIFELVNCFFGASLPLYVVYLVIARTKDPGVMVYRKMLATNALIDVMYTLSTLMSFPTIVFSSSRLIPIMTNPFLPKQGVWLFFMVQTFFIYLSVMILPIQFFYRYRVASSQSHTFNVILIPLVSAGVYNAIHAVLVLYTFQSPNEEYDQVLNDLGVENTGQKYVVGDVVKNFWLIPHFGNCMLMTTASYIAIVVYYVKTKKCLARFECHLNESTRRAQRQMNKILILQALYPIFLLSIPSIILPLAPIINLNSVVLGNICISSLHLIPALNALSVIFCVPSYRRYTFYLLLRHVVDTNKIQNYVDSSRVNSLTIHRSTPHA